MNVPGFDVHGEVADQYTSLKIDHLPITLGVALVKDIAAYVNRHVEHA